MFAVVNIVTNEAGGAGEVICDIGGKFYEIVRAFWEVGGASCESCPP
jgi:hypothetical protein